MSIKNKFATAVATASLLAGLFGSAFVPSVSAAVVTPADAVVPKYTTLTHGGEVQKASTKVYGFQTNDSNAVAGEADTAWIAVELFSDGAAGAGNTVYDFEAANNDEVLLKATSSNSSVQVGFGYDSVDSSVEACSGANMVFGTSATVFDVDGTDEGPGIVDSAYKICLRSKLATTAATSTITVTVDGVVATTFTVTAVGPIASLTASITGGYKYIAEDNDYLDEWLTIIAKDAAGVQINGATNTVSAEEITLTDWADNPDNQQGDPIAVFDTSMDGDTIGTGTADIGYDVDDNVCQSETGAGEDDGDAGNSYAVKFEDASGDIVSNAVTITCTLNSDGARVTAVNPEVLTATGSPNATGGITYNETAAGSDDQLSLVATVVDEDGVSLGDGARDMDFDWSFSGDADLDHSTGYATHRATGGVATVGYLEPDTSRFGRFTYTVTAADSDLAITAAGDDAVEKAFTKTFTAINSASSSTITKVRNAAKTIAVFTADMGEDAAFDTVVFTVELKNGTVVEYNRRANANGVAKLTLSKRNTTVFVYATYNDDTNVIKSVFR